MNEDQARAALTQPGFGSGGSIPEQDPIEPTEMYIPLGSIHRFELNPRITRNDKWEEIKDSIHKTRLRQRLPVTRRPGADHYVLAEGGNTRHGILCELAEEHPDDLRYKDIPVTFIPYPGEAALFAAHLSENDQRSDLKFYERALGVMAFKHACEEAGSAPLTQAELVDLLEGQGYKVAVNQVGYMDFAVNVIGDNLYQAFRAGLGRPAVIELKKFLNAWTQWWAWRECGSEEMAIEMFGQILHKNDSPDFDITKFRRQLDEEARMVADATIMEVSCELGSYLDESGCVRPDGDTYREAVALEEAQRHETSPPSQQNDTFTEYGHDHIEDEDKDFELRTYDAPPLDPEDATAQDTSPPSVPQDDGENVFKFNHSPPDKPPAFAPQHRSDIEPAAAPLASQSTSRMPTDDKTLRGRMYTYALKICTHYDMQSLLEPCRNSVRGLGFIIDFPTSLADPSALTPDGHAAWWLLATLSEQFHTWPERALEALPHEWHPRDIARAFKDSDRPERLIAYIEQNTQPLFGPALAPALFSGATSVGRRDYKDVQALISTYQELTSQNNNVWEIDQ